jgi:hypothetical protein
MRSRLLVLGACAVAAVASVVAGGPPERSTPAAGSAPTPAVAPPVLVYYFHATTRCATCRTIEAYAHETVSTAFAADLKAGTLEWRAVNVDEPANRHFVRDYRLYTRSVVVVDGKDPKRFKVLDQVWQLVHDKPAFQGYVERELRAFRRG